MATQPSANPKICSHSFSECSLNPVYLNCTSRAPGRSLATQIRQALLLGLAYNLYCLRHRFPQRGCQQSPTLTREFTSVDSKGGYVAQKLCKCFVCLQWGWTLGRATGLSTEVSNVQSIREAAVYQEKGTAGTSQNPQPLKRRLRLCLAPARSQERRARE